MAAVFSSSGFGLRGFSAEVAGFNGSVPAFRASTSLETDGRTHLLRAGGSEWAVSTRERGIPGRHDAWEYTVEFTVLSRSLSNANLVVSFDFTAWSRENYVLMPAAAYNGNRFHCVPGSYPPFLHEGTGPSMPVTITDVPRLNDGPGQSVIHLCSGDMATPAVGIHAPVTGKGFLLIAEHATPIGHTGLRIEESADRRRAGVRLEAPVVRQTTYLHCRTGVPSTDTGHGFHAGDGVTLRFMVHLFDCPDISALFTRFFECRQDLEAPPPPPRPVLPFSSAFRIIERKYLADQWNEAQGFLCVGVDDSVIYNAWQAGWVGGGMNSLAFLSDGSALSRERARRTMDAVFGLLQSPSGFVYPIMASGEFYGDDFCHKDDRNVLLVRKNADVLLFAARHILLLQKRKERVPENWLVGLRRLADAFVRLWDRHGQFGQFIDIERETILQGGTASAGSAPGALALAWRILGERRYLDTALASARQFSEWHVSRGLLNGGPGEALQCPDSESAFGTLESLVTIYETTGDPAWLPVAEECARICASWCVSYDFEFPGGSTFGRMGMRTTGSVWANVQNKHAAPGICTLSGTSLLRLYRATGNPRYLRLCREIAHNLPQYLSRADRPVVAGDGRPLPPGWMCERVNTSDWETKQGVGEVFYGSCWCEVSCLLVYSEIPGVWLFTDTGDAVTFDHVLARVEDEASAWRLTVSNPTGFEADVKILAEPRAGFARPWGECVLEGCPVLRVAAGGEAGITFPKAVSAPAS
jgi:hypothetical protein